MTHPLPVPPASAEPTAHADWLELRALAGDDRNSSIQDLVHAIRRSGTTDMLRDDLDEDAEGGYSSDVGMEESQRVAEAAFAEIEDRLNACGSDGGYPFKVAKNYLELKPGAESAPYVFLLLLTQYGHQAGPAGLGGDRLFEDLCTAAAKDHFDGRRGGGDAVAFGFPRRVLPASFGAAIDKLCSTLGEGGCHRDSPKSKNQKDARLDVVAWRNFADRRPGKVVGFGQCATGHTAWREKATHLNPNAFCNKWLRDMPLVDPVRMFFVPWRVHLPDWSHLCYDGGLVFDRCRIVQHSATLDHGLEKNCKRWGTKVVKERLRA